MSISTTVADELLRELKMWKVANFEKQIKFERCKIYPKAFAHELLTNQLGDIITLIESKIETMTINEQIIKTIQLHENEALALKALLSDQTHRKLTTRLTAASIDEEGFDEMDIAAGCNSLIELKDSL